MKQTTRIILLVLTIAAILFFRLGQVSAAQIIEPSSSTSQKTELKFTGPIESMDGTQWVIDGKAVSVDPAVAAAGTFKVGDIVKIEGYLLPDGSVNARNVEASNSVGENSNDDNSNSAYDDDSNDDNSNSTTNDNNNESNSNDDNSNSSLEDNSNDSHSQSHDSQDDHGSNSNSNDNGSHDDHGHDDNSNDDHGGHQEDNSNDSSGNENESNSNGN